MLFAVTDEPQSTRAWERGAIGEEKLAKALDAVPGLQVLHDRRVPGTRGNIDHIVIAPAGIFVVDAKHYKGKIEIRDKGGWFKTDERLYVGGRDRSHLAKEMAWQVEAVRHALAAAGSDFIDMPLEPVLCFIDGEWPLLFPPTKFGGVHIEGKRSIKKLVTKTATLDEAMIQRVARLLAAHLPAK